MTVLDQFNLSSRIAVVTGGAGLLGSQFARALAQAGSHVVIADLKTEAAENLAASLEQAGARALAVPTDVSDPISVQQLVDTTLASFGQLDILVNSAALDPKFDPQHGGEHTLPFEDYPIEAWNRSLAVDLTGAFLCAQAVARPMLAQDRGVMINLCSIYGLSGPDQRLYQRGREPPAYKPVAYSVTKAGVLGLTRYLAAYFAGKNIRVNALTPGGVFNDHDSEFVQAYSARTILGRMARVNELDAALLFLASDASSYMTGANLVVDGGWTAW